MNGATTDPFDNTKSVPNNKTIIATGSIQYILLRIKNIKNSFSISNI